MARWQFEDAIVIWLLETLSLKTDSKTKNSLAIITLSFQTIEMAFNFQFVKSTPNA